MISALTGPINVKCVSTELGGLPYIRTLFERPFLQEGHMASRSSSFCSGALPLTGVESVDWDLED